MDSSRQASSRPLLRNSRREENELTQEALSRPLRRPSSMGRIALAARTLRRIIVPVGLLLLWQVVTILGVFDRSQLPGPVDVLLAGWELQTTNQLVGHLLASISRVLWGFAGGGLLAIILGLAVGLSRNVEELLAPTI